MGTTGRKSGGAKKYGRNLAKCKVYRDNGTRERNKARKAHKERVKAAKLARKRERQMIRDTVNDFKTGNYHKMPERG